MLALFTRSRYEPEPLLRESPSRLLGVWVRRSASRGKGRVIVDLGRSSSKSLGFYSSQASLVFFQELSDELLSADSHAREKLIADVIPSRSGVLIDLVTCWDIVNYLSPAELKLFATKLAEHSHESTMVHFYLWRTRNMPPQPAHFEIIGQDRVRYSCLDDDCPAPRFHMSDMRHLLPGFRRVQSYLLRGGLEEQLYIRDTPPKTELE